MSQAGLESLRKFIVHEIAMMASEYAQAFFKQDEKEGPRDFGTSCKDFRVLQVGINVDNRDRDQGSSGTTSDTPSSGGSRKFWWGGILSTKPQTFGCLH